MSSIEKRPIGRSNIFVPPLCVGGNVFGWTADEARSFELLDASWPPAATSSTPPTSIPAGFPATPAANRKPSLATG